MVSTGNRIAIRLAKEAKNIVENFPDMSLNVIDEKNNIWRITFTMAEGNVYAGESYTLQFKFDDKYPFEAPEVIFVNKPPLHEHIYSNGYICLSILDKDWTPALQTSQGVMSIMSMMASASSKKAPDDDT